jgi:hypothetical protein
VARIAAVYPSHLPQIALRHQDYVACEMTAFLRAWLGGLPCPVVNPPTTLCLSGPAWTPVQWAQVCSQLEIPVVPVRLAVPAHPPVSPEAAVCRVIVTRSTTIAETDCSSELTERARRLADAANVQLLAVTFDGRDDQARVSYVDSWPDLTDPLVLAALDPIFDQPVSIS